MPRQVIVTRPAPDAQRWVEQLRQRGVAAEALPLIEIAGVADASAARAAWARLPDYAALMFVSGNAVEHFFAARPPAEATDSLARPRPLGAPGLRWMAPGPGTARVLAAHGVPAAQIDTPDARASQFDSEALWQQVGRRDWTGQRVLIVRGQSESFTDMPDVAAPGREWLARQLQAAGAQVDFVAVYERRAPRFQAAQRQRISASQCDGSVWLFSSSEALAHLPTADWSQARAIATHPRIAAAARAAGWHVVIESRPTLDDIVASIESMHS